MTRTAVVLVNYRGARDTKSCIQSLLACSAHPQLVVVDNTPNDPELEAVVASYPSAKLIRAPENLGFGRGNNLGIDWALAHSGCEFVLILNNDTTIKPDAIQQMEAAMDRHQEAGIVTARIVLAEDESKLWYGGGEVDWRRGGGRVPGMLGPADAPLALQARHVTFASGCAMMVRKEALQELGGFDARYFMYEEDMELCLRMAKQGRKVWYESSAIVVHEGQGSLKETQGGKFISAWAPDNPNLPFYVFHIMRNRLLTMKTYAVGKNRREFLLYFPLFIMAKLIRFASHRRWGAIKAMYMGWRAYRQETKKDMNCE